MKSLGIVSQEKTIFTKEDLIEKIPSKKKTITDEVVQLINDSNNDPEFSGNEFMDTLIDYQSAMLESSASIKEYVNAIRFCAFLESETDSGGTITEAYMKARPKDLVVIEGTGADKDSKEWKKLRSTASRYRKNKLVQRILTQSDMPLYLMFQGARYKAVAVLAREMEHSKHARDRIQAADKLLTHVKPPDNVQVELDIGASGSSALEDLNAQLAEIATKQKVHLTNGTMNLGDMGALKPADEDDIIDVDFDARIAPRMN